jgi:hypothetical protein
LRPPPLSELGVKVGASDAEVEELIEGWRKVKD